MLDLLARWWSDPQASASLFIALVAAVFAIYQLRAVPQERRRRILDSMLEQYRVSAGHRGTVLRSFPQLTLLAYQAVGRAVTEEIERTTARLPTDDGESRLLAEQELRPLRDLAAQAALWSDPGLGISHTGAHEILASEFKFRAFLWSIETIRDPQHWNAVGLTDDLVATARTLVNELNDFALDYENGAFPPRSMFGQFHRSIAPSCTAVQPLIWEAGLEGRWGRRVLRLGMAAEHFNDVVHVHRTSPITWRNAAGIRVVTHPARSQDLYGKEIVGQDVPVVPGEPTVAPLLRMRIRSRYWALVGKLAPRPSNPLWSFGGSRLRKHRRAEDKLAACLRYTMKKLTAERGRHRALDFSWTLPSLQEGMASATRIGRARTPESRGAPH